MGLLTGGSNKPSASSSQPQPLSVPSIRATTARSSAGPSYSQSQSPIASSTRDSADRPFTAMPTVSVSSAGEQLSSQLTLQCLLSLNLLKRIPRASREQAVSKLAIILERVVSDNDLAVWERLLLFSLCCLRVPS